MIQANELYDVVLVEENCNQLDKCPFEHQEKHYHCRWVRALAVKIDSRDQLHNAIIV